MIASLYSAPPGLPRWLSDKESICQWRRHKRCSFDPWVRKIPWSRKWQPTPLFLLAKFHEQRSLVGYSPWGHKESDTAEHTHTHTHIQPLEVSSVVSLYLGHLVLAHCLWWEHHWHFEFTADGCALPGGWSVLFFTWVICRDVDGPKVCQTK